MRNDFDDVVAMTFVERNCGGVIDGGLEANGTLLVVGVLMDPIEVPAMQLVFGKRRI